MKPILVTLSACLAFAGCASEKHSGEPALEGLATTSAVLVALPLIPFAEVYHAASGDVRKAREHAEAIRARFDPVYEARITLITQRDPMKDAEFIQKEGFVALLPSLPDGRNFPGLETSDYDLGAFPENASIVRKDQLLTYLQSLMSQDPAEKEMEKDGIIYSSPTYRRFLKATWQYKTVFNREMYAKRKQNQPNQALLPTTTAVTPAASHPSRQP